MGLSSALVGLIADGDADEHRLAVADDPQRQGVVAAVQGVAHRPSGLGWRCHGMGADADDHVTWLQARGFSRRAGLNALDHRALGPVGHIELITDFRR